MLLIFPGFMVCHFAEFVVGRLPYAISLISGALVTLALVGGTLALACRCRVQSNEWLPLLGAFLVSCSLWRAASAMLAA